MGSSWIILLLEQDNPSIRIAGIARRVVMFDVEGKNITLPARRDLEDLQITTRLSLHMATWEAAPDVLIVAFELSSLLSMWLDAWILAENELQNYLEAGHMKDQPQDYLS
ncbi:hypothetical protein Taro_039754 [Colocasia esculenta]|uniref:Uncharacterized protein n=1 Tax=Colocasia esculenta TaxID=4460 RepID=A0A843WN55_COLES|nr:hypothetical protein [Colocasia esculenta]